MFVLSRRADKMNSQTELDRPTFPSDEIGCYVSRESCRALKDGIDGINHGTTARKMNELQPPECVP